MKPTNYCRNSPDPVCYAPARYIWRKARGKHRSRKRKEIYRCFIRMLSYNHDGPCSIRDIEDDYRYECCKQWWNEIHKNRPYKYNPNH